MTVGERIRRARKAKGLTQKALGEACGIADPTIRRYELGKLNPKLETLQKIAKGLSISIFFLLGWENEQGELDLGLMQLETGLSEEETFAFALFEELNNEGQRRAIEHLQELAQIPEYQKVKEESSGE